MKNHCEKCPFFYGNDDDYGCFIFGKECNKCKSFNEDEMGCNVHPKRLQFLAMRRKERFEAYIKREEKRNFVYDRFYTKKEKRDDGYIIILNGKDAGFSIDHYHPPMKGGHTHNHVKNAMRRMLNRQRRYV